MADEPKRKPQLGDADYVGYCSPPLSGQFKKGHSGNPGGKPNWVKSDTEESVYEREMNRKITVTIDGKRRRIPKREAIMILLIGRALQADPKALAAVLRTEEKFGHLRIVEPKSDVQTGVLVVGPSLTIEEWEAIYGGPKKLPPFPLLDKLRAELFGKDEPDDDKV